MGFVKNSKPPAMPNTVPDASAKPSTAPSPRPPRPVAEWHKDMEKDIQRLQTADLSKVKVW